MPCVDGPMHVAVACRSSLLEPETVLQANEPLVSRLANASHITETSAYATSESHLITGGTAGLGLLTARWLAQRGARLLVLASRGGALARELKDEWVHAQEATISTVAQRCDTTDPTHVLRLVLIGHALLPATGVWHAAGVIADGVLPTQSAGSLAHVYAPKVHGSWALQHACASMALRTCAFFSSVTALLGGAGQANYSAANACLDALAAMRCAHSTTSASVQWGAWAEVGMASRGTASERIAAMEAASGFGRIGLAQGLASLHVAVLPRAASSVGVVPIQWHRMVGDGPVPTFLSGMVPRSSGGTRPVSVQQAACIVSLDAVLDMVRRTAGSSVDADAPLMQAGIDSLGAVELRNQLQRAVGERVALSSTLMFDHPTARQVALHLDSNRPVAASGDRGRGMDLILSPSQVEIAGTNMALGRSLSGLDALRKMSHCGRDLLCVIPLSRWDVELAALDLEGAPPEVASRVRHGGFVCDCLLYTSPSPRDS